MEHRLDIETEYGSASGSAANHFVVDFIDVRTGMHPLLSAPREHLCNMKLPVVTMPYDGADNLQVFNTRLNKVLMYCLSYKLTGPGRDQTLMRFRVRSPTRRAYGIIP